jgi:hypothetical protein
VCLNRGDKDSGEIFCADCYNHHFPSGAKTARPSCPCGGQLSCMSVKERRQQLLGETNKRSWATLLQCHTEPKAQEDISCELCHRELDDDYVWTCSNGNSTVLHMHGHDICEGCLRHHAITGARRVRREAWSAMELTMEQEPARNASAYFPEQL